MAKIMVYLVDQGRDMLQQRVQRVMRISRAQAALIIRRELIRLGRLSEPTNAQAIEKPEEVQA